MFYMYVLQYAYDVGLCVCLCVRVDLCVCVFRHSLKAISLRLLLLISSCVGLACVVTA